MKIIIAVVTLFALLAPNASADHATRGALRVLKGMSKEGKKGGKKGGMKGVSKRGGMKGVSKKGGESAVPSREAPASPSSPV
jgi:hypothetical protein